MLRRVSKMMPLDQISQSFEFPSVDPTTIPKVLFGHRSSVESLNDTELNNESRVLVIYTGGTIGMMNNERGKLAPIPRAMESCLRLYPHMHDAAYAAKRSSREKNRILYWVYEYNPLLDSSDMTMDDWIRVAMDIKREYENFDGFVRVTRYGYSCLHSFCSFVHDGELGETNYSLTGSQIPLFETRSDGRDNFIGSVIVAGLYPIPEVTVFFNNKLYRGNRTVKVSTGSLDAFDSPNLSPLAVAGISIQVDYRLIFHPKSIAKFEVTDQLNRHIGLLRLFPSISAETVRTLLQPPTAGAVLQTYGSGNIPSNRKDLLEILKEATSRGVLIVNITQCSHGGVEAIYETGEILRDAGVFPGFDMTPEAALTKLSYITGKDWDWETKCKMLMQNIRGELTSLNEDENDCGSTGILSILTKALQLSDSAEVEQIRDINYTITGGITALHVAVSEGDDDVVRWLLENGASVHLRDSNGHTPLWYAVEKDNMNIIFLLRKTGAHLVEPLLFLGETIVTAGGNNNLTRLRSLEAAGCDMSLTDICSRTGLHAQMFYSLLEEWEPLRNRIFDFTRNNKAIILHVIFVTIIIVELSHFNGRNSVIL
ncbi:L-asparaginase [Armadillidium vulgare]|nr:L-asparaginase [Armadillidium vulgare]